MMKDQFKKPAAYLTAGALLIALDVVFARLLSISIPGVDTLSLQFLPNAIAGLLFGPWAGALVCVAGDILGMLVNGKGLVFNPLYTFSAAVTGVIYGLVLYKKSIGMVRCLIACFAANIVVFLGMNPMWIYLYFVNADNPRAYLPILLPKIPFRLVFAPLSAYILYFVGKRIKNVFDRRFN